MGSWGQRPLWEDPRGDNEGQDWESRMDWESKNGTLEGEGV